MPQPTTLSTIPTFYLLFTTIDPLTALSGDLAPLLAPESLIWSLSKNVSLSNSMLSHCFMRDNQCYWMSHKQMYHQDNNTVINPSLMLPRPFSASLPTHPLHHQLPHKNLQTNLITPPRLKPPLLPSPLNIHLKHLLTAPTLPHALHRHRLAQNHNHEVLLDTPLPQIRDPDPQRAEHLDADPEAKTPVGLDVHVAARDGGGTGHFAQEAEHGDADGAVANAEVADCV